MTMAEEKAAPEAAKGAKKEPKKKEGAPHESARQEKKKSRWTLEMCMKYARRFESREAWQAGAPSSFKSAMSHGWVEACCAKMTAHPVKKAVAKKAHAPRMAS
jgi:hypothetical protein